MNISEVPVGCEIQFLGPVKPTGGSKYIITAAHDGWCCSLEATDYTSLGNRPARWTAWPCTSETLVEIVGGFEHYISNEPVDPGQAESAKHALLNLIGETCTTTASLNTTVPDVTYLLDTAVIIM